MELGSFEAAHTSLISADPRIDSVLGLDGRIYLVERGNFIKELFHNEKISFDLCDFEIDSLKPFGRFDVVFCSGVLYHLTKPWRLLKDIAKVSDRLFLSTHFANEGKTMLKGYRGTVHGEFGFLEPLSGLDNHSFWPTLESLKEMLGDCGFTIAQSKIYSDGRQDPLANFYCHAKK